MKLENKLQISLSKRSGHVVLRRELANLGSASQLTEAIKSMVDAGRLVRLGSGVYAKAYRDTEGQVHLTAEPDALAREVFQKLGIEVHVVKRGQQGADGVYVLCKGEKRVSRKLNFGGTAVSYLDRRQMPRTGVDSVPAEVDRLPTRGVREFVERVAQAYGVTYRRTGLDDFAEAVTRLAGDDVKLDRTSKLLVALKRKHVINGRQLARLVTNYMRESEGDEGIRSVRGLPDRGLPAQH